MNCLWCTRPKTFKLLPLCKLCQKLKDECTSYNYLSKKGIPRERDFFGFVRAGLTLTVISEYGNYYLLNRETGIPKGLRNSKNYYAHEVAIANYPYVGIHNFNKQKEVNTLWIYSKMLIIFFIIVDASYIFSGTVNGLTWIQRNFVRRDREIIDLFERLYVVKK